MCNIVKDRVDANECDALGGPADCMAMKFYEALFLERVRNDINVVRPAKGKVAEGEE